MAERVDPSPLYAGEDRDGIGVAEDESGASDDECWSFFLRPPLGSQPFGGPRLF